MIIPLDKIKKHNLPLVGSKAFGLAQMEQIGFTIPSGFCITTTAYQEHIESNKLSDKIKSALEKLNSTHPKEKAVLLEIRQAITNAPLSDKLCNDIESYYHKLDASRVAVRSSATAEDLPGHSFAGQYETYLGVTSLSDCTEAIKKCWASLWTERAYGYRQKNNFDHFAVNMAVIVQELIEADASGVIFTADPVNGYKSRIIIEAVSGLGEAIVSGRVTPDRFIVRRRNLKIISRRIKNGKTEFFKDANKINQTINPCLDNGTAKKLAKSARKMEIKFGCLQDIEWAVINNRIFFLQTRPITTIPKQKSWEGRQVWTNANTGEVMPDVVTPTTWSVLKTVLEEIFDHTLNLIAINRGNNPLIDLVAGKIYFNINTLIAVFKVLPVLRHLDVNKFFGGEHERMYALGLLDIPDEDTPILQFGLTKFILKMPGLLFRILTYTHKRGERMIMKLNSKIGHSPDVDFSAMSEEQLAKRLLKEISNLRNALIDARYGALYTVIGFSIFPALDKVCKKWFGTEGSTFANELLAGLGDIESARAALDLWRLAEKAHEFPEIKSIILSETNWVKIRVKITGVNRGDEFLKNWDQFIVDHGHHCRGELEVYNPRWVESPNYILSLLHTYITSLEQTRPLENYKIRAQRRNELMLQCRQQLKNPVKRMIFNYLLDHAQRFSAIRENSKNNLVKVAAGWRVILLELGKRLKENGAFKNIDDIFFLKLEEIEPVVKNKAEFDIKKAIASRRSEYEKNKSVIPPKVVVGKFDPDNYTPDVADTNVEVFKGLAVSSGVVTGKARVILKADTDEQVLPGEILVAPFTDPGWTPYFIPAVAIVMDMGGMLSHGSIIAREYGIPAVVNVGQATKIIKTGQTIQVDANRGLVKIL